ncbi:hypothetical protein ACGFIP_16325 [Micromonospora zamorensis]|uniref:hypothetical protein n=1 Tax=Micromonospora TaxID=1873 RepID=UPI0033E39295
MIDEFFELALLVVDKSGVVLERCNAIPRMTEIDPVRAKEILLGIASTWDESDEVLRQAGKWLGLIAAKAGYLSEWDMRDITEVAYAAYCEWLTLE